MPLPASENPRRRPRQHSSSRRYGSKSVCPARHPRILALGVHRHAPCQCRQTIVRCDDSLQLMIRAIVDNDKDLFAPPLAHPLPSHPAVNSNQSSFAESSLSWAVFAWEPLTTLKRRWLFKHKEGSILDGAQDFCRPAYAEADPNVHQEVRDTGKDHGSTLPHLLPRHDCRRGENGASCASLRTSASMCVAIRNYAEIIATLDRTIIIENIDIFPQK